MSRSDVPSVTPEPERNLVYFADPMCSWCYGFAPVMRALADQFDGALGLRIVTGGLQPGHTLELRPKDRAYLQETWQRVAEASGQPFDFSCLDREAFIYDTEPACRAVVVARSVGDRAALDLMAAISSAFYAHNRDVTREDVLADIAGEHGHDRSEFAAALATPGARETTALDFAFAKQSGVEGFPCLVAGNEQLGYALVSHGFRPLDGLPEAISTWLDAAPTKTA